MPMTPNCFEPKPTGIYTDAAEWSADQHEAAAAMLGYSVVVLFRCATIDHGVDTDFVRGMNEGLEIAINVLTKEAASRFHAAEREREKMAAELQRHVTFGTGPELTTDEIVNAALRFCGSCGSYPCRCCGVPR